MGANADADSETESSMDNSFDSSKGMEKLLKADAIDESDEDIDNIDNDEVDLFADSDDIDTSSKKKDKKEDKEVDKKGEKKPEREEIPIRDEELYSINQGQNEPIQKKPTNKSHTPKSKMHL